MLTRDTFTKRGKKKNRRRNHDNTVGAGQIQNFRPICKNGNHWLLTQLGIGYVFLHALAGTNSQSKWPKMVPKCDNRDKTTSMDQTWVFLEKGSKPRFLQKSQPMFEPRFEPRTSQLWDRRTNNYAINVARFIMVLHTKPSEKHSHCDRSDKE